MYSNTIWEAKEQIRQYLLNLNFVESFNLRAKEHDSLYSLYDDYIDIKIKVKEEEYIVEKLATVLDLEQKIIEIAGRHKIYFEFVKKV